MSIEVALQRIGQLQSLLASTAAPPPPRPAPAATGFDAELERAGQAQEASVKARRAASPEAPTAVPSTAAPLTSAGAGKLAWPVDAPISSRFGPRWGRMHSGLDLAAAQGTPVQAAAPGRVKSASFDGGYGNLVVIQHPDGSETRYAHMASLGVKAGQTVGAGDKVGTVGNTGNSTGPHLHFELRVDGQPRDPLKSLPRR